MNKRVAILATNGFEESELKSPKEYLEEQGWTADIVSLKSGKIKAWANGNWSNEYDVNYTLDEVSCSDYNALVLPGGVINPDLLRREESAIKFVKAFFDEKKPVAAICHGPQLLINAEVVDGRELTSFHSVKKDLQNAGAKWVDKEVVVDNGLVTSRTPDDLPAFNKKMVEEIKEGKHELQRS
ncbi:type 1 glutamine amidotransferase domain-containing protein [Flavobacterium sp. NRK1]|jgi:protease I|uniref:type 1 glutamine amidotransferase domain-containing protein n=1 Tax=Flavobacterium sp. NRK1 TaxID=2954929 RepID=UPI002093BE27|nr:type 1 glutamine amidotransferase domain-containing protein [Flavobacterium sp. NRK1]MCO6148705.1 type 1 glutamine amidotransferase [Flavobacterium sp. NRK1]